MSPKGMLALTLIDQNALYKAYMPFLKNGGLFLPTRKRYALGQDVFLILNLLDESDKIPVAGTVAWITPRGAQGNLPAGIGVHFSDVDGTGLALKNRIENYLEKHNQALPTSTM